MLFLAWRQLISRKKQTLLVLLGISFGTLLFVSIAGVQLGMRAFMAEQFLNNTAHILISGAERNVDPEEVKEAFYPNSVVNWISAPSGLREEVRLENYAGWYQYLSEHPEVVDFSPRLNVEAIANNGKFTAALNLIGTVPEKHLRITSIEKYMREGSFGALKGGTNNIVIGSGVAEKLGTRLDKYIGLRTGAGGARSFKVVGIVHLGNEEVDDSLAFADLNDVQVLARTPGRVSQIAVALYDIDRADEVAVEWKLFSKDKVQDWQEANQMFMEMIKVQDFTRYFITTAVLIVAAFGIYNVLSIMINQKKKEIAILRAIGYAPNKILLLVLYQGLFLGLTGGSLGLLLGYLLSRWFGSIDFDFELGGSHNLWISYHWSIYVTAFVSANLAAMVASFIPAHFASRLTPMDIIRSE
jgi:lipoprotein-releasing system permease protein